MGFVVKKALRENIFAKIALMSPSGGGKTYSSLKIATGMANEIEKTTGSRPKIIVGSTEQKRGYYYANEFDYDIVDIEAPHNPEKYVEFIDFAIDTCPIATGVSITVHTSRSNPELRTFPKLLREFHIPLMTSSFTASYLYLFISIFRSWQEVLRLSLIA